MKSFGDMMKQAQKMQKQMGELQNQLADERYEGTAGGGLVKAVVDGKQMLKEIKLSPKMLEEKDVTLLEDLVITAIGEAQRTSQEKMAEAYSKVTGGFNLPF
jgi:DNA-binding YbaB/EbfC family protein